MNNEINAWLNSLHDYDTGVDLYCRFGHSQNLKRILERSESTPDHIATLIFELGKLSDIPDQHASTRPAMPRNAAIVNQVVIQQLVEPSDSNALEDIALFEAIKQKLKLRDNLHATLEHVDQKQRETNAFLILELSDQISEDYERHDHFKKHGVVPQAKTIEVKLTPAVKGVNMSEAEWINYRNNVRSKISYYRNRVKDPLLGNKLSHNQSCLVMWEKELSEISKILDNGSFQTK